jgi:hypothetical protein
MTTLMKHVGKFGEKPCLVVFRELPGETDYCLIVQTDNLDSRQHDDLMNVIQSSEAQTANNVSEVLHRRQFTDGSNMLSTLHYAKKLQKVPVSHVSLTPIPGQSIPLADVNVEIRKLEGGYVAPKTQQDPNQTRVTSEDVERPLDPTKAVETDPTLANSNSETEQVAGNDVARNLLVQAQLMEEDGNRLITEALAKKEEAYKLDPSLRGPGRPKKVKSS